MLQAQDKYGIHCQGGLKWADAKSCGQVLDNFAVGSRGSRSWKPPTRIDDLAMIRCC